MKLLTFEQITTFFPGIFKRLFNKPAPQRFPPIVIIDNDDIGFCSGFFMNDDCFYIQYIGIYPEFRTKKRMSSQMNSLKDYLRKKGVRYLIGYIENNNTRAICSALVTGFKITGVRVTNPKNETIVVVTQTL